MHEIALSVLPNDLVFDIGANVGDKADWFAKRGASVVAVEPQPALVQHLSRRFSDNPSVIIVPKGLSAENGILPMSINTTNCVLSTFSDEWKTGRFQGADWDQVVNIEVITLDALVKEYGCPRYTKIDVEGFETQVISGLSKKIGAISFEFTSEFFSDVVKICDQLDRLGYSKFNFSTGEEVNYYYPAWKSKDELMHGLGAFCGLDNLLWGDVYAV